MGVGSDAGNSGWVAGDDWYTRIEVTWNSDDTKCVYTATVKVYSAYWTNRNSGVNYNINIAGNQKSGSVGSPGITPGNWATIASHSATVYRNHSSQTFAISGWVGASSGASSYTSGATAWWPASSHPLGALASYAVTYNANGGSSAPGQQTKWFNESLTLSTSQPTKNGYTFKGWATSSGGSVAYSPGATYTGNAALTLYAVWQVWTYTVSYNANGGSGAPGSQTKTWGQNLTLSSTKPTRSLYNFKGWGTSSGSTSASYQPGGTYSTNAAITLYAVWEVAWVAPRITNVSVYRSDANKNASDDGTCITVKFNWATDNAVTTCRASVNGTWQNLTAGGTKSGSVSQVLSGTYSAESSHTVSINVADSTGGSTVSATVSSAHYIMDVSKVGAVGFNTVADSSTKRMDVNMAAYITGALSAASAAVTNALTAASAKISGALTAGSVVTPTITSTGAMTIKANNASSNVTLNNTVFGNNSMNTTTGTIDNLYWDSTLLGGRCGVKLWSGTLSKGGSITVSNLNRYRVLMVVLNSIAEAGLMAVRSDSVYCTAGWAYDNGSSSYVYKATFKKDSASSTKLTLVSASRHVLDAGCAGEIQNVVALWGLI